MRDVYVVDGRVRSEQVKGAKTLATDGWLLPGLVDAHAHLALASPLARGSTAERVRASARAHLDAGVLLVREPGGPDRSSVGLGPKEGLPRVVSGGRFLAPPGGYFPGLAREVTAAQLAAAAAEEAKASGQWAKVIGDFVGDDGTLVPHWEPDTLRRAAKAVHQAGARIAIHAVVPQVIESAIDAGFDAIEHGIGLQDEHIEAMLDRRTVLVPTLLIREAVPEALGSMLRPEARASLQGWLASWPRMAAAASRAGVTVLAGTDAGMGPHGMVSQEVARLLDAGLPPEVALGAASWTAREYLGLPAIEDGAPADIVLFDDDPRKSLRTLQRPRIILLDGRLVHAS